LSRQTDALEQVLPRIVEAAAGCGVLLQGSVSRGEETDGSDLDVTVVVPDGTEIVPNDLIHEGNRFGMCRVDAEVYGVAVDINWLHLSDLTRIVRERGAYSWFMFATGRAVHDPEGLAAGGQKLCRAWFAAHPEVRHAWEAQQARVARAKADPTVTLEFPTQPEFVAHLVSTYGSRDG